jgi:acyl carrier protein
MLAQTTDDIRELILTALAPKLATSLATTVVDNDTNLTEFGLIDSADLMEVIMWVEEKAKIEFNPERLELENGVTLQNLIDAFAARSDPDGA